jgi:26 proteasome complex subunit DSS1
MSGAPSGSAPTSKLTTADNKKNTPADTEPATAKANDPKSAAPLEEDDEFEDFPVEDWQEEDTQLPGGNAHLWEESWDDDDTNEDFAVQLK